MKHLLISIGLIAGNTLLFCYLVARYWIHYDMGIGGPANGLALMFLFLPIMLFAQVLVSALGLAIFTQFKFSRLAILISIAVLQFSTVGAGLFLAEADALAGYPEANMLEYLGAYFE